MWGSIANLKENLNKIALDVHYDDDVVFPAYGSPAAAGDNSAVSDRRNSHSFAHSKSVPRSPVANGITDHPYASEVSSFCCVFSAFGFKFLTLVHEIYDKVVW